jgi:hypothetical protein
MGHCGTSRIVLAFSLWLVFADGISTDESEKTGYFQKLLITTFFKTNET